MKKITSLTLGITFLVMSYTGIMLFIVPHGRVAYWANWHLFGLSKSQYGDIHTTSMVAFLIFATLHIYYNFKPIVSYLKDKTKKISFTKKEFLIALLINVIFVVGTLIPVHPFKGFMAMGEKIKESWTKTYGEPPYGHAEETKLKIFCRKMGIDLNNAKDILNENDIKFEENETLKAIGINNSIAPSKVYDMIKPKNVNSKELSEISNMGRKTLQDLSDMKKIDLNYALDVLNKKGLNDVTRESKMKHIADELDLTPRDVYKLITSR